MCKRRREDTTTYHDDGRFKNSSSNHPNIQKRTLTQKGKTSIALAVASIALFSYIDSGNENTHAYVLYSIKSMLIKIEFFLYICNVYSVA